MACNPKSVLAFLLIFNVLLAIAGHAFAGREIPTDSKNVDKKKPQSFIDSDGNVLVPGIGRFMLPRAGSSFDPSTYNPVTGTNGGAGVGGTGDDSTGGNPSVEVPSSGSGGSAPAVARP